MGSPTANYGWTKPTVGGDSGSWGTELNSTLDAIDSEVHTIAQGSGAASLPLSGGVLTGPLDVKVGSMARQDLGSVSGSVTLDLSVAQEFTANITGATTFKLVNARPGTVAEGVVLFLQGAGAYAITWDASAAIKWPGGAAPSFSTGLDVLVLITKDNGASYCAGLALKACA